jgi:hypothetical protein
MGANHLWNIDDQAPDDRSGIIRTCNRCGEQEVREKGSWRSLPRGCGEYVIGLRVHSKGKLTMNHSIGSIGAPAGRSGGGGACGDAGPILSNPNGGVQIAATELIVYKNPDNFVATGHTEPLRGVVRASRGGLYWVETQGSGWMQQWVASECYKTRDEAVAVIVGRTLDEGRKLIERSLRVAQTIKGVGK